MPQIVTPGNEGIEKAISSPILYDGRIVRRVGENKEFPLVAYFINLKLEGKVFKWGSRAQQNDALEGLKRAINPAPDLAVITMFTTDATIYRVNRDSMYEFCPGESYVLENGIYHLDEEIGIPTCSIETKILHQETEILERAETLAQYFASRRRQFLNAKIRRKDSFFDSSEVQGFDVTHGVEKKE